MKYDEIPVSGNGMDIRAAGPMFVMIEHAVLDDYPQMTPHQFIVYAALLAYANAEARAIPGITALAKRAHIGTTATKEALNKLVEYGLVIKVPRVDEAGDPTSNLYVVYRPSTAKGVGRQTTDPRRQTTQGGSADDPGWVAKRPLSRTTEVEPPENRVNTPNPWNETAHFQEFWNLYPRRIAKPPAERAFHKTIGETNFSDLMAGLQRWLASAEWNPVKERMQFIPHPATFLNERRWQDTPIAEVTAIEEKQAGVAGTSRSYTREELRERFSAGGR